MQNFDILRAEQNFEIFGYFAGDPLNTDAEISYQPELSDLEHRILTAHLVPTSFNSTKIVSTAIQLYSKQKTYQTNALNETKTNDMIQIWLLEIFLGKTLTANRKDLNRSLPVLEVEKL